MQPTFWKLSQGPYYFDHSEILSSINEGLVYAHRDTKPKGRSSQSQADDFIDADIGNYFYLTNGNEGIYLLGQFTGPTNVLSAKGDGWLDRPFRTIRTSRSREIYDGPQKWWAPNDNSTFTAVPENDIQLFEEYILRPYFGIDLVDFGIVDG